MQDAVQVQPRQTLKKVKAANKLSVEDPDEDLEEGTGIVLTEQPSLLTGGQLKDYQLQGLNWMISLHELGINGILADEMGLGKTIQTIAFISFLKESLQISGPHLIVAPTTTLTNWVNEFHKWFPSCRVVKLYATKEQREDTFENELLDGKFDVCVTSYESINICHTQLRKFRWSYIIVDEAHRLKNEASLFSQNLRRFKTNLKLLITGTPLQNNLHELWSLLNFLLPQLFADSKVFDEWTGKYPQKTETSAEALAEQEERNLGLISSLRKILTPFILRRTKESVSQGLPPKKEIQILIGLSDKQLEIYKNILLKKSPSGDTKYARNILMQVRLV